MSANILSDQALDQLFRTARTANAWKNEPVSDDLLKNIYDTMKFGPTSANMSPLRIVFVKTPEAKEKLKPAIGAGNIDKVMTAPVTAIFAHDMAFFEHLKFLFPHADAKSWFVGNDKMIADGAFRNGTLQAAYFMLSARAHGLDCGPMSGFDNAKVDELFFAGSTFKSNFICSLGHGDHSKTFARSPRFGFDDVCKIA